MKRYIRAYTEGDSITIPADFYKYLIRDAKESSSSFKARLQYIKDRSPFWDAPETVETVISNPDDLSAKQMMSLVDQTLRTINPGDVITYTTRGRYASNQEQMIIKLNDFYYMYLAELYNYLQDFAPVTNCKTSESKVYNNLEYLVKNGQLKTLKVKTFW